MKIIVSVILIGLALAGCVPSIWSTTEPQDMTPITNPFAEPAAANPTAQIGATEKTIPSVKVLSVTGGPPRLLLVPGEGTPASFNPTPTPIAFAGWKTFISAALHVALNYPSGWSVAEQTNGASFTSPSAAVISLQAITINGTNSENQQCTTLITAYGQTANLCVKANIFRAEFNLQLADSVSESLMISTTNSNALDVYKEMINTLHPLQ